MKHLMLFETFYGLLQIRIMHGFLGDNKKYYNEAVDLAVSSVAEHINQPNAEYFIRHDIEENVNKSISLFALDPDDKVVGVLFMNTESIFQNFDKYKNQGVKITELVDLTKYRDQKALHGFLFAVKKEDRKSYIAWMLIHEIPKRFTHHYDYFYGVQSEMFKKNVNYDKRAMKIAKLSGHFAGQGGHVYLKELS